MTNASITQQVKFDAICMQCEQAWRDGQNPALEVFLEESPVAERPLLLPQLLLLELEYVEKTGTPPAIEAYLQRFPQDHAVVRNAFEAHAVACEAAKDAPVDGNDAGTIDQQPITEREGSQIGRYKLLEQIGEGGMGVVYMAEQQRPVRRKVALKIIKPGMDTKQVVARFEAERQALAMMDHPNIARVLDAGATESSRPYFVMELVRGTTITEYCDANKLDTDERLKLFKSVCQAVQHAHTKGIIHRDLKPTNVLVTLHDGVPVPKIIDFGVSKAMGQQLTEKTMFTAFAQMVGTPLYMSPEQAEMSGLDIDTRSDIYSLGVLLYELLTGVTPFDRKRLHTAAFDELRRIIREEEPEKPSTRISSLGDSSETVSAQRSTDPTKLKQLLRGELDWIVMKSLEKDRNRRYETANALVAEVDRYLAGEPVHACPPSTTYRLRKFASRYRTQVTVAAGFVTLLMVSSVVAWLLYADARQARNDERAAKDEVLAAKDNVTAERDRAIAAERTAKRERDRADQNAKELRSRLYDYNLSKAHTAYRDGDPLRVGKFLDDCTEEQRRWEWHYLRRLAHVPRELELNIPAQTLAVSPADPLLLVGSVDGRVQLLNEPDGRVVWERPTGDRFVITAFFSHDGKYAAVTHANQNLAVSPPQFDTLNGGLQLWDAATGEMIWEQTRERGMVAGLAFSPNGQHLVVVSAESLSDMSIQWRDRETATEVWSVDTRGIPHSAVFSSDGQRLFLSEWSTGSFESPSTLTCLNLADQTIVWSTSRPVSSSIAITNDGERLITCGSGHTVHVWDAATGEQLETFTSGEKDAAVHVLLSRDERFLLSQGHVATTIWDWQSRQTVRTLRFAHPDRVPWGGIVLPDNEFASLEAMPASRIRLVKIDAEPPVLVLKGHNEAVRGVTFTPDGKRILSTSFDGTLRTWKVASGQEINVNAIGNRPVLAVAFSPLGDLFATGDEEGICVWNADTLELVHRWPETSRVRSLQFSPDGQRLIAATYRSGHGLQLIEVGNEREVVEREIQRMHGAVFSADGRHAVSLSLGKRPGQLDIWDLESNRGPRTLRPSTGRVFASDLVRIPYSSDNGTNLVAATISNTIEVWNIETQQQVMTLQGHEDWVACLAVSRDGTRLFSGDILGVVRIWNLNTGEQVFTWRAHKRTKVAKWGTARGVMSMALSPDGKTLATTGADGLVKLWETTYPSQALARQREIVRTATELVNARYRELSSHRDVMASLLSDKSLEEDVLQMAVDISQARGDTQLAEDREDRFVLESGFHLSNSQYFDSSENDWQKAIDALSSRLQVIDIGSDVWHGNAFRLSFLLAYAGATEDYNELCQKTFDNFGDTTSTMIAERTIKMCLFSKLAPVDLDKVGSLADRTWDAWSPAGPDARFWPLPQAGKRDG